MTRIPEIWSAALDTRRELPEFSDGRLALRLLHTEDPYVRCDRFGPVCWFYWYHLAPPTTQELEQIADFSAQAGAADWAVRYMQNRGADPHQQLLWQSRPFSSWQCTEHALEYELRVQQGLSPGLFLDQANNRKWVQGSATGTRVLNLFSYTGGFGLCAAKGAASRVVNVDTSNATLKWAQTNATLNNLQMEFYKTDAREYLKRGRKQGLLFDCIICDPPSFARSKNGIWKIEKDLPDLVRLLLPLLAPGGTALVSSNFEGWSLKRFTRILQGVLPGDCTLEPGLPLPAWLTCASKSDLLKSCFIKRQ